VNLEDILRVKGTQFRHEIINHWSEFSSDDLDSIEGKPDNLVILLESRYGYARGRAEREGERVVTEFEEKLHRAS